MYNGKCTERKKAPATAIAREWMRQCMERERDGIKMGTSTIVRWINRLKSVCRMYRHRRLARVVIVVAASAERRRIWFELSKHTYFLCLSFSRSLTRFVRSLADIPILTLGSLFLSLLSFILSFLRYFSLSVEMLQTSAPLYCFVQLWAFIWNNDCNIVYGVVDSMVVAYG